MGHTTGKCEKGHIFIGVCTREASVGTYVGGDRNVWGLIGTRALWHNRRKVRGDYGDGFSTGSTVRIRLNTDSGALSYGVDQTDWGVDFDGLTQCGPLYLAVGLYQREDQITVLPVSDKSSSVEVLLQLSSESSARIPRILTPFLRYSFTLMDDVKAMDASRMNSSKSSSLPVDGRIFNTMLLIVREMDPLLYGALPVM